MTRIYQKSIDGMSILIDLLMRLHMAIEQKLNLVEFSTVNILRIFNWQIIGAKRARRPKREREREIVAELPETVQRQINGMLYNVTWNDRLDKNVSSKCAIYEEGHDSYGFGHGNLCSTACYQYGHLTTSIHHTHIESQWTMKFGVCLCAYAHVNDIIYY